MSRPVATGRPSVPFGSGPAARMAPIVPLGDPSVTPIYLGVRAAAWLPPMPPLEIVMSESQGKVVAITGFTVDLTGRAALVTGGASGIGFATAGLFARNGARVAINHLPGDPAGPEAADRLRADGHDVLAVAGNVADPASAAPMVAEAVDRLGRLDVLVNNAGTPMTREPIPFSD